MQEQLSRISELLGRIDPLKSLLWSLVLGVAVATSAYCSIENHLSNLDDLNILRKTEVITLTKRFDDLQHDREENIKEAREWREITSKQIGRIQGILEAHFGAKGNE